KTLGNVYDPIPLIEKYGADPLRYYCLAKTSPFTDGDFSEEKFVETYNSDLANGLGNLVARVANLCESSELRVKNYELRFTQNKFIDEFKFNEALFEIWQEISQVDQQIEKDQPWKTKKTEDLVGYVEKIRTIATNLLPFMPQTAQKILDQFKGPEIKGGEVLFPRIK
ncbi:MAG: class I tRNA ligase family protein, partial [Patescibacteria group bacterium]